MHQKSIELLNRGLADEMWAVHQYLYFHFHADDQGYDPLAALFKRIAIGEMAHIEVFAERILFLGGKVVLEASHPVEDITDVRGMLEKARDMEINAVRDYNDFANQCSANADAASRKIFEELVTDEEGHADIFRTQLEHLEKFGEQFLALQSIERAKSQGSGPTS